MTTFRTIPADGRPLRVILVGAGPMGRTWLKNLTASKDVTLVGLVDLDLEAATSALATAGLTGLSIATSITDLLRREEADAVINVTVPVAHHAVTSEALFAGLPVLTEKPIAPAVGEALRLAAVAEITGELLMVSQSRRYYRTIKEFKNVIASLDRVGVVATEFFKAPHFGGFRDEMEHPLLVDMAIHAFDAYRYLLEDEPISVLCEEFNPPWSWYRGSAAATASFETLSGGRYVYTGSWCSPGLETSWNGNWRVSAANGSVTWNGEDAPVADTEPKVTAADPGPIPEEIAGSLAEFVQALRGGHTPVGIALQNIPSLVMVEAATRSAASGARVRLSDVVDEALDEAIAVETRDDVAETLRKWSLSPTTAGLTRLGSSSL